MNKEIKRRLLSIISISIFLILMTTFVYLPKQQNLLSSFAFLQSQRSFYMQDLTTGVLLKDAYPTKDEMGLKNNPYTFKVVNNTNKDITYNIIFQNNETKALEREKDVLPNRYLRYSLSDINDTNLEANTLPNDGIILTTTIKANSESIFNFRMWLDYNSDEGAMNKIFIGNIKIEEIK